MGFLAPTIEELADNAMQKLQSGAASSIVDAARKARLAYGLKSDPSKIRAITAELGRRSQRAMKARKDASANALYTLKIGQ